MVLNVGNIVGTVVIDVGTTVVNVGIIVNDVGTTVLNVGVFEGIIVGEFVIIVGFL